VRIYSCEELLDEYRNVIARGKFAALISSVQSEKWIRLCMRVTVKATLRKKVSVSRDSKNNYLLSLSEECNADYLVTGDDDLLSLGKYKRTKIVNMPDFLKALSDL